MVASILVAAVHDSYFVGVAASGHKAYYSKLKNPFVSVSPLPANINSPSISFLA